MIRRRSSISLQHDGGAPSWRRDDVDPNSSLTNIADCMLVLMLGFLIALVSRYGIDLVPKEETKGVEVNMDANADGAIDDNYSTAGTVYLDAETGKYYLVEE